MMTSFYGRRVTVMGLGLHGGGVGVVKFLLREGAKDILVTDLKSKQRLLPSLRQLPKSPRIRYALGGHRLRDFENRDAIIKNPDVPSSSKYLLHAAKNGLPILSDIGIFFERARAPIIGVTGTKGKSTTATLIALLLKTRFRRVMLAGNIRKSALEIIGRAERADIIVLELSSFQLEDLIYVKKSPHIAVITSIFPDHINRHKTFSKYRRVKSSITFFQKKSDTVVIPGRRGLEALVRKCRARKIIVKISGKDRKNIGLLNPALAGHMADAAMLAMAVAKILGVGPKETVACLKHFRPLAGRMQVVGVKNGVTFINDTTATNPTAAALDLELIAGRFPRVILIAGGSDKKLSMDQFAKIIRRYSHHLILLPGSATEKLKKSMGGWGRDRITAASSMKRAVRGACRIASRGDAVLLSPGAASFGLFLHEFDRGNKFVRAVNKVPQYSANNKVRLKL